MSNPAGAALYPKPWDGTFVAYNAAANSANDNVVTRGDYAVCSGDAEGPFQLAGPGSLAEGKTFPWPDTYSENSPYRCTGVTFVRSEIKIREIIDGTSQTLYAGEKYLNSDHYFTGMDGSDNESTYCGYDNDNARSAAFAPMRDRHGYYVYDYFGGAHATICNFVFCDGSVHGIAFTVDEATFRHLGNREDRVPIDKSLW